MGLEMEEWVEENLANINLDDEFTKRHLTLDDINFISDKSSNPDHWVQDKKETVDKEKSLPSLDVDS